MSSTALSLKARLVCPVSAASIEGGIVDVAEGRVVDIRDAPGREAIDLGDVALVPGLVNCHTHLEFSNLRTPLKPLRPFADWIGAVVAERRRRCRTDETGQRRERDPLAAGLRECFETGAALVGEIATGGLPNADRPEFVVQALGDDRLAPFRELIAPTPAGISAAWTAADETLRALDRHHPAHPPGLSPHSPYTVTAGLLEQAVQRAVTEARPLAMHLAETIEEIEFLTHRSGHLADMLQRLGQWEPAALFGRRPLELLEALSAAPRVLIVHGNFLEEEELEFLGRRGHMSLIYCPRTHAYFGHSKFPLEAAIRQGVNVALGTDSRASNPDLNLWEEAKAVANAFPEFTPETVLEMATVNGARALGRAERHGSIERGRPADFCCIQLDPTEADPLRGLVGPGAEVVGVMHSGEWIVEPPSVRRLRCRE